MAITSSLRSDLVAVELALLLERDGAREIR
jgi:hypothetical protein